MLTLLSSSCSLLYKTATLKMSTFGKGVTDALSASEMPAEQTSRRQFDGTRSEPLENHLNLEDSDEWGEANVVSTASKSDQKLSRFGPQVTRRPVWDLPWHEDDLKHFKRVQIPDFEVYDRLPNAYTLARLSSAYGSIVAKTLDAMSKHIRAKNNKIPGGLFMLLSRLETYAENIFQISQHPSTSLIRSDADLDWRTELWSRVWTRSNDMTDKSKQLFREAMITYHEIKYQGYLKSTEKKLAERVDMIDFLIANSAALKTALDVLSEIDDTWRLGGQLTTRSISQRMRDGKEEADVGAATCLEVTNKYIIVALDNATISILDHSGKFLRNLRGHVMGVWAVAACDDLLASGGVDRDLRIWDMSNGYVLNKLSEKPRYVILSHIF
jgi:WD40 repeat protein